MTDVVWGQVKICQKMQQAKIFPSTKGPALAHTLAEFQDALNHPSPMWENYEGIKPLRTNGNYGAYIMDANEAAMGVFRFRMKIRG